MLVMVLIGLVVGLPGAPSASAQAPPAPKLSAPQLEELVGRIALYPDDLLAIVLPSAKTPLELVKAQRFLDQHKKDPKLTPDKTLPEPVRNLLNYPDLIKMMTEDLDWTEKLGQAVTGQQKDVLTAIQTFRRKAQAAGNLKTDDKQVVIVEKEVIKIIPADPQVIYVPQYQPTTVVVVQSSPPPPAYYPTPYPVYYYPYPPGAAMATGFFIGAATASACNWGASTINTNVNVNTQINNYQAQRQQYASQAQSSAQQAASTRQTQRQEASGQNQAQRQEAASGAQDQRAQMQTQRQDSASQAQGQQSQTQAQRQQGASQAQPATQQASADQRGAGTGQAQASQQPAQSGGRSSGSQGGAFGGTGSGTQTSQMSQRGAESRAAMGGAGGGSRSGGSSGGGGKRR
jgi:hypothetical protein